MTLSNSTTVPNDDPKKLCLYNVLAARANQTPDAVAILAPHRAPLTYRGLFIHIENTVKRLNSMGIGRNDRVAIVLPNGPEMATAFLAVASGATSAPLNPSYKASEYDFYLSDLNAKALIIQANIDSPAIEVAQKRGIPVISLSPAIEEEAGIFELEGDENSLPDEVDFAEPEDVALVLHTSGTTSRPKIVPLAHSNICTSAKNIRTTLKLTTEDRCMNIMPLFHIHGLMGATLSSLSAGASIVCTPGFYAPRFFEWMEEFRPSWYSAVPTMHQGILARAEANAETIEKCPLRFIRSSSASLPPKVMASLESTFNVPVVESYGMTEASHQMASNPLPPGERKAGSVGPAAGPEVAIMDEEGNLLSQGETGEIVIRGANVMHGYENNPEANESAFTNGWFRTGDQGYLDSDNYLFITGRLKEIINRGGEKISPREIDEVLMEAPVVVQAVTFAIPHPRLGEDVAAAVVLKEGKSSNAGSGRRNLTTDRYLREFVAERLAAFKAPSRIVILDEIPKGPTGKLQRIGLAKSLGLDVLEPVKEVEFVAPRNQTEKALAEVWSHVIGVSQIGIHDDFFDLGGDSMLAAQMFAQVQKTFGKILPLTTLFHASTVEQMAAVLSQKKKTDAFSTMVPLKPSGSRTPFFCIHSCLAEVLNYYDLALHINPDRPFYGLRAQGIYGEKEPYRRHEEMAAYYVKEIRKVQSEGPYLLGGVSAGGWTALEVAQQLLAQNQEVAMLVLMDTPYNERLPGRSSQGQGSSASTPSETSSLRPQAFYSHGSWLYYPRRIIYRVKNRELMQGFGRVYRDVHKKYYWKFAYSSIARRVNFIRRRINYLDHVREILSRSQRYYRRKKYPGKALYFLSEQQKQHFNPKWHELIAGGMEIHEVPGGHLDIMREPNVRVLAKQLNISLDEIDANL